MRDFFFVPYPNVLRLHLKREVGVQGRPPVQELIGPKVECVSRVTNLRMKTLSPSVRQKVARWEHLM